MLSAVDNLSGIDIFFIVSIFCFALKGSNKGKAVTKDFYPIADKKPYCRKNKKDIKVCLCHNL